MSDPFTFGAATARFSLPYLFTAQSQKEAFVNEAHLLSDALLHPVILGSRTEPVEGAEDGDCWLVAQGASGTFEGHEDDIAIHEGGQWIFVSPVPAMSIFDASSGKRCYYNGSWRSAENLSPPEGGNVIDAEARSAIAALIDILETGGLLPIMQNS